MFKECKGHKDQAECVVSLVEKCDEIKDTFGYSDQDARSLVCNNIRVISYSNVLLLNLLESWVIGDEMVRSFIPQVIGLQKPTEKQVAVAGRTLHRSSRLSLVLLAQFQIENCIRSIVRELGIVDRSTGFYSVAKKLISELSLPDSDLDILNVSALIRNSLHSNGIHHSIGKQAKSIETEIDGVMYKFVDGEAVHCASVEHIAHAIENSMSILEKIFNNPQVEAMPDPIADTYLMYYTGKP